MNQTTNNCPIDYRAEVDRLARIIADESRDKEYRRLVAKELRELVAGAEKLRELGRGNEVIV